MQTMSDRSELDGHRLKVPNEREFGYAQVEVRETDSALIRGIEDFSDRRKANRAAGRGDESRRQK